MAESNEVLERYQELLEAYRKAMVEFVQAYERYMARMPAFKALESGEDLIPQHVDIEELAALGQEVDRKRKRMQDTWDECIGLQEQHRAFLKNV